MYCSYRLPWGIMLMPEDRYGLRYVRYACSAVTDHKGILGYLGIMTLSLIWPVILMEVIEEHLQSFSVEWAKELHPTQVSKSVDVCVRVGGKGSGVGSRILFSVCYAIVSKVPNVSLEKGVCRECFPSTLETMWTVKKRQLCAKGSEGESEKFAAIWSIKTADSICVLRTSHPRVHRVCACALKTRASKSMGKWERAVHIWEPSGEEWGGRAIHSESFEMAVRPRTQIASPPLRHICIP